MQNDKKQSGYAARYLVRSDATSIEGGFKIRERRKERQREREREREREERAFEE